MKTELSGLARGFAAAVALLFTPQSANAADFNAHFAPWKIAEERELSPGTFVSLRREISGWRIWRQKTKFGAACVAVKPASGISPPVPMLGTESFYGSPGLRLAYHGTDSDVPHLLWNIISRHPGKSRGEFRVAGEQFYSPAPERSAAAEAWLPLLRLEGRVVDIHVASWRYPESLVGVADEVGTIDLTGMRDASEEVMRCASEGDQH